MVKLSQVNLRNPESKLALFISGDRKASHGTRGEHATHRVGHKLTANSCRGYAPTEILPAQPALAPR